MPLLLLDEPTSGLDPLMDARFRQCMHEYRDRRHGSAEQSHPQRGRGALRPGHDHPQRSGHGSGSLAQLRHLARTKVVATVERMPDALAELPGVHEVTVDGQQVSCQVDPAGMPALLSVLADAGYRL